MDIYDKLETLENELNAEFKEHMIPFWKGMIDRNYGGYYGRMSFDLSLDNKADKGCILNSRILWFFSTLADYYDDEELLRYAAHAYRFMKERFFDKQSGGVYWSVAYDGNVDDDSKHTYNQAFAIYGLAAFYRASGDENALRDAYDLFDTIEARCRDSEGYLEAFSREFLPVSNEKLSENGVMADRTMNTILHVMEAYTELFDVDDNDVYGRRHSVKKRLIEILNIFKEKIYNPDLERLEVFFDKDYNSLIDLHSFGHDIEAAWLLDRTVQVLENNGTVVDEEISYIIETLTEKIYEDAFDGKSVPAESEDGKVLETRIWWVQSEAMNGFLNGYMYHGKNEKYAEAVINIWDYIKHTIVDKRCGSEWFSEVGADGTPDSSMDIVNEWKCPYHNGRMFVEMVSRIENILAEEEE